MIMILEMYAVHDAAVGAFNKPLFFRSRGEAVRSFQDAVRDPANGFGTHGADFTFWYLGGYDDSTGRVICDAPERVCGAKDFILPVAE